MTNHSVTLDRGIFYKLLQLLDSHYGVEIHAKESLNLLSIRIEGRLEFDAILGGSDETSQPD